MGRSCKTGAWSTSCPIYKIFAIIGKKWNIHILTLIAKGESTFSGIKEALHDLNSSILTQRLDELVSEGLVEKHILSQKPRMIRYNLSTDGKAMMKALKPFFTFSATMHTKK